MWSDLYGWIWNGLGSWDWNWNWTSTGTGLVSRIDGIGLVLDPETGTYVSEPDPCDRTRRGSGNLTGTGQELDLDRNLTWNGTLTGTGLVSRIKVIGLVLDPGTGTYVSELDRCDRTRRGSGNLTGTWPGTEPWQELDLELEQPR